MTALSITIIKTVVMRHVSIGAPRYSVFDSKQRDALHYGQDMFLSRSGPATVLASLLTIATQEDSSVWLASAAGLRVLSPAANSDYTEESPCVTIASSETHQCELCGSC